MPWVLTPDNIGAFTRPQIAFPESQYDFSTVPMGDDDLVAIGADLEPSTLINAYSHGLFPMPMSAKKIGWWCPVTRGIIPIDGLHVSRSLLKHLKRFTIRVDSCFAQVMKACGDPKRPHGWINLEFIRAYSYLHATGWAHSVEVFQDDELVGGVYGVRVGKLFAGESMFHTETDASKAALVALVALLEAADITLFDVQWTTPHLTSLGAIDIPRNDYLALLAQAQNRD
jgi:leucyl/phenylalanyl-tRNA--protein transferase